MARIPLAEDRIVFSGANFGGTPQFDGGAAPMVNFLANWSAERRSEVEMEAKQRVAGMAVRAQRELGDEAMADVPEGVRGVYAEVFQQQSEAVFAASFARSMQIETRSLVEQFQEDPEGFAQAYNEFMVGQLEPLESSNPFVAERLRQEMDAIGLDVMFSLQDDLAAAAAEQARFEALNDFSEFVIGSMDELNESGDETMLARSMGMADEILDDLLDAGFITPDQHRNQRQDFRNSAATEQAFGAFRQAVSRGDIGGAQAIIDRTERGVLFDSNPAGRAAASQLNTRLNRILAEAGERSANLHTRSMRTVGNYVDLAQAGENVRMDDPGLVSAFQTAMLHANTDAQVDAVQRAQADLAISMAMGPMLREAPLGDVLALREQIVQLPDQLPKGRARQALEAIDERLREVDEADFTGDIMRLANLPAGATPQQRHQARERVANQVQAPVEMVPHYSFDEVRRFQQEFRNAVDRQDSTAAVGFVERFFEPVGDDLASRLGLAQQYGESEFSAVASLAALVGGNNTVQLFEAARQGQALSSTERSDTRPPSDIADLAEAASMGHPDIRNQIESMLTDAWAGIATMRDERGSRGGFLWLGRTAVAQEFDRLTENMQDTVELVNGAKVPSALFAPGVSDKATKREINQFLSNPERFGVVPGDSNTMDTIRPRPLPDGGLVWFSTMAPNALIQDPETGGVLTSNLEQRVAPIRDAEAASRGFFERTADFFNRSGELISYGGFTSRVAPRAANATGATFGDLAALRMTFEDTPRRDRANRNASVLFDENALQSLSSAEYQSAWNRYQAAKSPERITPTGEPPNPMSSVEGAAVAAGVLLTKFRNKYGSEEQALAAYWIGEDAMDALGDAWQTALPQDADQFISRVLRHRNRVEQ